MIIVGLVWELKRYRFEQKRLSRKKAIVVEVRRLRDGPGQPLTPFRVTSRAIET
ncbi:hypothetical protein AB4Z10_27305 [Bosea sp. RAF48]|uniref:hypothetical protein n=1 Tax=Bosea sp. RAF48 TaxID=3237480 RepID=UPI003F8F5739